MRLGLLQIADNYVVLVPDVTQASWCLQVLQELRVVTSGFTASRMQITPEQGQFMAMLVKLIGAKNYLEIGVFTGYSLISTALALPPEGMAVGLDRDPRALDVARQFVEQAGLSCQIDIREGPAMASLDDVREEYGEGQFDLVFIDADKRGYKEYYERALDLVHPGGLVLIDNVLWYGKVADESVVDKQTQALRQLNADLFQDDRIDLSIVPIGDGIAMCRKQ